MKTARGLKGYIRRAMRTRLLAAAEITLIFGLILFDIWVVQPMDRPAEDLALRVAVGIILLASPWLHGDSLKRLGLRLDTFGAALGRLAPISILAAALAGAAGYFLMAIDPPDDPMVAVASYLAWAVAQQYALQGVVLLRLEDAGLRGTAPLAAAALFALVHAPNPGLMAFTFLGGLLWSVTFRRSPNLAAVAISHALLAVIVVSTLPREATGGLRIGPAYIEDVGSLSLPAGGDELVREGDDVLEPQRLEAQLGAKLGQFRLKRVVHNRARHDRDRGAAMLFGAPEPVEKAQTVDERHAKIDDDRVCVVLARLAEPVLGARCRPHVESVAMERRGERFHHRLIVVDNQNRRRRFLPADRIGSNGRNVHQLVGRRAARGHQQRFELPLTDERRGHRFEVLGNSAGRVVDDQLVGPFPTHTEGCQIPGDKVRSRHEKVKHGVRGLQQDPCPRALRGFARYCTGLALAPCDGTRQSRRNPGRRPAHFPI